MGLKSRIGSNIRNGMIGALFAVALGATLRFTPLGHGLEHFSYDLPFIFGPSIEFTNAVLLEMDQKSYEDKNQKWGQQWDRSLHAELLDRLTADQAKLVVFDIFLAEESSKVRDEQLARAIKANGKVVLAADLSHASHLDAGIRIVGNVPDPPRIEFVAAAAGWGIAHINKDADLGARQLYSGTGTKGSLPWVAAIRAGASLNDTDTERLRERWLNYYGPSKMISVLSYSEAGNQPSNYFRDKFVFIGSRPNIRYAAEEVDEYRTPFTGWGREGFVGGVEIVATTFFNLLHGDWLNRMSWVKELLVILLAGLLFGYGLNLVRPMVGATLAVFGFLAVALLAIALVWYQHVWFSWMVVAGVQIPCALAWSVLSFTKTLFREKKALETRLAAAPKAAPLPQPSSIQSERPTIVAGAAEARHIPSIPDHTLIRCVGKGSYGEVWLARNAIGMYQAVKIVHRAEFRDAAPYEREFKGIQKYMPISLNHPGLLRLLHVGRNDEAGYFYYMMEVGDDEITGQKIDPETYSPKNLAKELDKRRKLPVTECVQLSLTLAAALDHLHQQQLIHRDIKPSNIIFVNGVPKFADIGLVTDIVTKSGDATPVGTEGFIAPERVGSPAADIYSLGKVIYEASMGRGREFFPELPTTLVEREDHQELLLLNEIILKACETDLRIRYKSAAALRADLLALQHKISQKQNG